jgi:thioredoxin-related protein
MIKTFNFFILSCFLFLNTYGQPTNLAKPTEPANNNGLVKWLSFKEAFQLNKKNPKPFLIDVYTDWCGWCKHMIKTTYSNPALANYINTYFYPVQFDAETKDTIEYLGQKYWNESSKPRSPHQLAIKLLNGNLSYPTTLFVFNNLQNSMVVPGYLDEKQIEPILIFVVENIWRGSSFDDFKINFNKTFIDTSTTKNSLKLINFNDFEKIKTKKKKTIIVAYTSWCNGCKILNKTVLTDTLIAPYLSKNFQIIDFNIEQKDSIFFNGRYYKVSGKYGTFNDLAVELSGGHVGLPTLFILDEENKLLDRVPFYISAQNLEPILHFYAENAYQKTKWPEYLETFKKNKNSNTK